MKNVFAIQLKIIILMPVVSCKDPIRVSKNATLIGSFGFILYVISGCGVFPVENSFDTSNVWSSICL